eukprot:6733395-Prymnesium_polylepis.1
MRDAVARPPANGQVRLYLPAGSRFTLGGEHIAIHHADVTLASDGEGAEIDAEGLSRHFDVALGGKLHLEKVHLVNGGFEMSGGSVLVRNGGTLSAINALISDSEVLATSGTAVCKALCSSNCKCPVDVRICLCTQRGGAVAVESHN